MDRRASAPHVVVISGLSGGGKTAAAKLFEDLNYTVVDNLPGELLPAVLELVTEWGRGIDAELAALGVRTGFSLRAKARARALAQQPRVLLLDEPSSALDLKHRASLLRTLTRLRQDVSAIVQPEKEFIAGDKEITLQ